MDTCKFTHLGFPLAFPLLQLDRLYSRHLKQCTTIFELSIHKLTSSGSKLLCSLKSVTHGVVSSPGCNVAIHTGLAFAFSPRVFN